MVSGESIRLMRCISHNSQQEFSQLLGCSRSYLSMVEIGHKPVSKQLECRFFDVLQEIEISIITYQDIIASFNRINNKR